MACHSQRIVVLLDFSINFPRKLLIEGTGPPRWRRGSGLDCGSEDPGSIPGIPSPRVDPVFYGDLVYKLRRVKDTPNFISSGSKIVKRLRRRQYDPLIIETTIGLVLGPCTALCRLFLKHCTLTNKAVGTTWRALSKPPQRRQGPDLRPLWLLVGTPSAIRPELAFSRAEHSLPYSDVTIYIFFAILYLSSMPYV